MLVSSSNLFGLLASTSQDFWQLEGLDWVEKLESFSVMALLGTVALIAVLGVIGIVFKKIKGEDAQPSQPKPTTFGGWIIIALFGIGLGGGFAGMGLSWLLDEHVYPVKSIYHVANGGRKTLHFKFDNRSFDVPAKGWIMVRKRGGLSDCRISTFSGEGEVLEEPCREGVSVLNLSDDTAIAIEKLEYSKNYIPQIYIPTFGNQPPPNQPPRDIRGGGRGFWRVSKNPKAGIFDLDNKPPREIQVKEEEAKLPRYDVRWVKKSMPTVQSVPAIPPSDPELLRGTMDLRADTSVVGNVPGIVW